MLSLTQEIRSMKADRLDPADLARRKDASRASDERALRSGRLSPEDLQLQNGGNGLFRTAQIAWDDLPALA